MGSTVEHYRTLRKEIIDLNKQTYLLIDWTIHHNDYVSSSQIGL